MYLNITKRNATIAWETNFVIDPVPNPLGCVANDVNIICASNGPFKEDTGYVSLDGKTGSIQWRDKVLKFPSLPILDNYGDVTGSDGNKLVHYDANGKLYPVIPCEGLMPFIGIQLVGTDFLLLVSGDGTIVARETNGVPVASILLNDKVQGVNGTFIPISQPVVNGDRFYILTQFHPSDRLQDTPSLQRLYAIDIHHSLLRRITVAWYFEFPKNFPNLDKRIVERQWSKHTDTDYFKQKQQHGIGTSISQTLMWNNKNKQVYVNLPSLQRGIENTGTFWAFRDEGNHTTPAFRLDMNVNHMVQFEANTDENGKATTSKQSQLWLISTNGSLVAIDNDGSVVKTFNLKSYLRTDVRLTSKVVLTRPEDNGPEILIFALIVQNVTTKILAQISENDIGAVNSSFSSFVIAINTTADAGSSDVILWMVPVPENLYVYGQLSGSSGTESQRKDEIIFYAEEPGKSAKIFAIH